jgi:hypothetical protein
MDFIGPVSRRQGLQQQTTLIWALPPLAYPLCQFLVRQFLRGLAGNTFALDVPLPLLRRHFHEGLLSLSQRPIAATTRLCEVH